MLAHAPSASDSSATAALLRVMFGTVPPFAALRRARLRDSTRAVSRGPAKRVLRLQVAPCAFLRSILSGKPLLEIGVYPLLRRRALRQASGEGHDRGAHRTGHAHGRRRRAVVLRQALPAQETARPDRAQLHQPVPANLRRVVRVGIRKSRPRTQSARRRPARLQQPRPDAQRGARGTGPRLRVAGPRAATPGQRTPHPLPRRLVPTVFGLPPLLPEAGGSRHRRLRRWWRRCGIVANVTIALAM